MVVIYHLQVIQVVFKANTPSSALNDEVSRTKSGNTHAHHKFVAKVYKLGVTL